MNTDQTVLNPGPVYKCKTKQPYFVLLSCHRWPGFSIYGIILDIALLYIKYVISGYINLFRSTRKLDQRMNLMMKVFHKRGQLAK